MMSKKCQPLKKEGVTEQVKTQFVINFVKTAQKLFLHDSIEPSIKEKIVAGIVGLVGASISLTIPGGQAATRIVYNAGYLVVEEGIKAQKMVESTNTKLAIEKTLSDVTQPQHSLSADEQLHLFRRHFVEIALQIFHSFEYQFERIRRRVDSLRHDQIQAIKILGQYAGAKCFQKFANNPANPDDVISNFLSSDTDEMSKVLNLPTVVMETLLSKFKEWTTEKLFFILDPGKPLQSTNSRNFFSEPIPTFVRSVSRNRGKNEQSQLLEFEYKKFEKLSEWNKRNFKLTRLRRPFNFEQILNRGACQVTENFENQEFTLVIEDWVSVTEKFLKNILMDLQNDSEKMISMMTRLNLDMSNQFQSAKDHTSTEIAHGAKKVVTEVVTEVKKVAEKMDDLAVQVKSAARLVTEAHVPIECSPEVAVSTFVGRVDILEQIQDRLKKPVEEQQHPFERIVVLAGPGGIGKTETSKRFASKWSGKKIFIRAQTSELVKESFLNLAQKNGIIDNKDNVSSDIEIEKIAQEVYHHFSEKASDHLFIFDNAEDLISVRSSSSPENFDIFPFLPQYVLKLNPAILITSRKMEWGSVDKIHVIRMPFLSRGEAEKYFYGTLPISNLAEMNGVAEKMGQLIGILNGFPLAMRLAAGFIGQASKMEGLERAIQNYLNLFETRMTDWLTIEDPQLTRKYKYTMQTVWQKTFDTISNFDEDDREPWAIKFLKWMAYMEPEKIEVRDVDFVYDSIINFPDSVQDDKEISDYLKKPKLHLKTDENEVSLLVKYGLQMLENFCMILIPRGAGVSISSSLKIQVHRLIQEWARTKDEENEALLNLVSLGHVEVKSYYNHHLVKIHRALKDIGWPKDSIKFSLKVALQFLKILHRRHHYKVTVDVYTHLTRKQHNERQGLVDELSGLKLVLIHGKFYKYNKPEFDALLNTQTDQELLLWLLNPAIHDGFRRVMDYGDAEFMVYSIIVKFGDVGFLDKIAVGMLVNLVATFERPNTVRECLKLILEKYAHHLADEQMDKLWLKFSAIMSAPEFADDLRTDYKIVTYFLRLNYPRESQAIKLFGQQLVTVIRSPELMTATMQSYNFITEIFEVLTEMTRQEAVAYLLWTGTGATENEIVPAFVEALKEVLPQSLTRAEYFCIYVSTLFSDWVMAMCDRREFFHLIQSSHKCASGLKTILDTFEETIHRYQYTAIRRHEERKQRLLLKWYSPEMFTFRLIIQQILNGELEDHVE